MPLAFKSQLRTHFKLVGQERRGSDRSAIVKERDLDHNDS